MVEIVLTALHMRKKEGQKFFFQTSVTPHVDCQYVREPLESYTLQDGNYGW